MTSLQASTFLGGSRADYYVTIAVDSSGRIFVSGETRSTDFPTTGGAYDTTHNGGIFDYGSDVFISRLDANLSSLQASTFLGGSPEDDRITVAVDSSGRIFVSGETRSPDFPITSGAYDTTYNGFLNSDVFISRLDANLSSLQASTFLGGSLRGEYNPAIAIDSTGRIFVSGETRSTDFPTTGGAYDTTYDDNDVFISRLDADLSNLQASTFLGGSISEYTPAIAIDSSGRIFVSGESSSTDFPTTGGAYDTSYNGDGIFGSDVFISRLDADLTSLQASTFLGGSDGESIPVIAIDSSGRIFVSGETRSPDFPTTGGTYDRTYDGIFSDVFISRLDADLTSLQASTFLGGSFYEHSPAIAIDSSGRIFVSGETWSTDFPTTGGAYDTTHNGYYDVFISRLDANLSSLQASTFLGGSKNEYSPAIAIDSSGQVFVSGETFSTDFPTTGGAYDTTHNGGYDVFISRLNPDLTTLGTSTYFGGNAWDELNGMVLGLNDEVILVGRTYSADFSTTAGALDADNTKCDSLFITRLSCGHDPEFPWLLFNPAIISGGQVQ